jgi:hypothetical protein
MSKLSSINHKEGLLIKSAYPITLQIPYNIFTIFPDTQMSLYKDGWFLIGTQFDQLATNIATKVNEQSKTLKYILKLNQPSTWSIYAPINNSEVDSSLPRLDTVQPMDSYWLNITSP